MEDDKQPLPTPSEPKDIKTSSEDDIVSPVDIDFAEYRHKTDMRTARRNVALPLWLNFEAEKAA